MLECSRGQWHGKLYEDLLGDESGYNYQIAPVDGAKMDPDKYGGYPAGLPPCSCTEDDPRCVTPGSSGNCLVCRESRDSRESLTTHTCTSIHAYFSHFFYIGLRDGRRVQHAGRDGRDVDLFLQGHVGRPAQFRAQVQRLAPAGGLGHPPRAPLGF